MMCASLLFFLLTNSFTFYKAFIFIKPPSLFPSQNLYAKVTNIKNDIIMIDYYYK